MPGRCAQSLDTGVRSALAVPQGPVQTQMMGIISGKKYPRGASWVCSFFCSSTALTKLPLLCHRCAEWRPLRQCPGMAGPG